MELKSFWNEKCPHKGDRWTIVVGMLIELNLKCSFGVIYGGNDQDSMRSIYNGILATISNIQAPFLLMGDSNEVSEEKDRKGYNKNNKSIFEFRN